MRVEILKLSDGYWLVIRTDDQMLFAKEHLKLIEALESADILQVHVDNADDFKVKQYKRTS